MWEEEGRVWKNNMDHKSTAGEGPGELLCASKSSTHLPSPLEFQFINSQV